MTRPHALSLLFMLLLPAGCLPFAAVPALTPGSPRLAKPPAAARATAATAAVDLAYSNYNILMWVRAAGKAMMFYDSIDTAKNLPSNLRSLGPTLAAADKLRRENKDHEAIKAYRSITGGEIDTARLGRSYLGQALVFANNPEQRKKAIELLRLAVSYLPDNGDARLALALNYCFQLEWDNALQAARRAVPMQPNDPLARYWLGWIHFYGLQDNAKAIAHFQEALRLKPNDEHALQELGIVYVYKAEYENAITYLQRVISLKPENGGAYWFLGITYLKMGDRPQAQQVYQTLQRINKDLAAEFAGRM